MIKSHPTNGKVYYQSIYEYKQKCRQEPKHLMGNCPRLYIDIMRNIDGLKYFDGPDYAGIYKKLREYTIQKNCQVNSVRNTN